MKWKLLLWGMVLVGCISLAYAVDNTYYWIRPYTTSNATSSSNCTCTVNGSSINYMGDGIYLYNDTTTMYLNETKLNATIDNRATGGTSDGTGGWINNSLKTFTQLQIQTNNSINITNPLNDGSFLFIDSNTIFMNRSSTSIPTAQKMAPAILIAKDSLTGGCEFNVTQSGSLRYSFCTSEWQTPGVSDWELGNLALAGNYYRYNYYNPGLVVQIMNKTYDTAIAQDAMSTGSMAHWYTQTTYWRTRSGNLTFIPQTMMVINPINPANNVPALVVNDNGTKTGNAIELRDVDSTNTPFAVEKDGDVVITNRRSNPTLTLSPSTNGTIDPTITFMDTAATGGQIWYDNDQGNMMYDSVHAASNKIQFRLKTSTSPVNALTIEVGGDVGFGMSDPEYLIDARKYYANTSDDRIVANFGRTGEAKNTSAKGAGVVFSVGTTESMAGGIFGVRENSQTNYYGDLKLMNCNTGGACTTAAGLTETVRIKNDGKVGIRTSTPESNLKVNGTANITADAFVGNITFMDTYWDDMLMPVITGAKGIDNPPTLTTFKNNISAYAFHNEIGGNENEVFLTMQMSHRYKLGTNIECHLHWACASTTAENITWALEITKADMNGVFGASTTYKTSDDCGTAYTHTISDFGYIGTFNNLSGVAQMKLYRDSTNANDTYTGDDVYALSADCHYEIDSPGSRTELIK